MRVLIAPDSFSGTLPAPRAAAAMAAGWRRNRPDDELRVLPLSDGGDGLVEVVAAALPQALRRRTEVADARGIATTAEWLRLPDGRAVIESAQACGLHRLPPERWDPLLTTTYGVGQLLLAAAADGATAVLVGLGGSATVDAGLGAAIALGCRLLRADGNGVKVGGRWTADLHRVAHVAPFAPAVVCAADVSAPLLGPEGAARRYGPQKGADAAAVELLEANNAVVADVVERDVPGGPWRDLPGAGAAGGLGFGLAAFVGADLRPGAQEIAGLVGLEAALAGVDVIVTGEGRLDAGTQQGKVCGYLAARGAQRSIPVLVITGSAEAAAAKDFAAVAELGAQGLERPEPAIAEAAAGLARDLAV